MAGQPQKDPGTIGKFSPKSLDRLLVQDREEFDKAHREMLAKVTDLRARGSREEQILLFKMQMQAEIAIRFPKASMRARAEEEWHAVASKMAQAKTPPEEIRKYLRKRALDYREPNPLELKAFSDKAAQQLAALGSISFETIVAVLADEAERMAAAVAEAGPRS